MAPSGRMGEPACHWTFCLCPAHIGEGQAASLGTVLWPSISEVPNAPIHSLFQCLESHSQTPFPQLLPGPPGM